MLVAGSTGGGGGGAVATTGVAMLGGSCVAWTLALRRTTTIVPAATTSRPTAAIPSIAGVFFPFGEGTGVPASRVTPMSVGTFAGRIICGVPGNVLAVAASP